MNAALNCALIGTSFCFKLAVKLTDNDEKSDRATDFIERKESCYYFNMVL